MAGYTDNPQQRAALIRNRAARTVRARFPAGTVVRGRGAGPDAPSGVVLRHIPMGDAQGGVLVVRWDNGITGRAQPGALLVAAPPTAPEPV